MEAKETAGLPMTERVARDCSSGLLETTSNTLWSAAKTNTHQLLQKEKERREEEREGGNKRKRRRFSNKIEMNVRGSEENKDKRLGGILAYWQRMREMGKTVL